jgi:hypothetical protein
MLGFARIIFLGVALFVAVNGNASRADTTAPTYPATPRGDVVDNYFGTSVPDPYRWMEENSPQTVAWVSIPEACGCDSGPGSNVGDAAPANPPVLRKGMGVSFQNRLV